MERIKEKQKAIIKSNSFGSFFLNGEFIKPIIHYRNLVQLSVLYTSEF